MSENQILTSQTLIVNRAEIVSHGCSACGENLAADAQGARTLSALVEPDNTVYIFCAGCGDSIMSHVTADAARDKYSWDWAVPLRGRPIPSPNHQQTAPEVAASPA